MDGIPFLIVIAGFILAIVALKKIAALGRRVEALAQQVAALAAEPRGQAVAAPAPAEELAAEPEPVAEAIEVPAEAEAAPPPEQPIITEAPANANWQPGRTTAPAARRDVEQAIASRWFVWIGGIAIAIGGLLFVKYAYDNGLISPSLQVALGLIVAAALVAAGEWVRRRGGDQGYVPAALSAAGLATAFASIYAAYALYELIAPTLAFAGLALVGLAALALSRLEGPFIAALGLLGSYVTPALIPSEHPSAWGFFPYLAVILVASFATLRGRPWWWLGLAALAASTLWSLLWVLGGPFTTADTLPVGLFALLMGAIAVLGLRGRNVFATLDAQGTAWPPFDPAALIGAAGLAAEVIVLGTLVGETGHANLALSLFFIAMAELVAIAWLVAELTLLAPIAALLSLAALMVWSDVSMQEWAMDERGFWTTVLGPEALRFLDWMIAAAAAFTLAGLAGLRFRPGRELWALLAAASSFLFLFGAWGRADALVSDTGWIIGALAVALVLLAVGLSRRDADAPLGLPAGILAAGAAAHLLFAADRLFDNVWLTLAVAGLAAAYAFLALVLRSFLMGPVTAALASFVTLRLFISRELWLEDRSLPLGQHWVIYGYGIPAVLFYVGSRALRTAGHLRAAVSLEGLSLGLAISLVSLEIRVLINGNLVTDAPGLVEMAAHVLTWAGAAYGLMYRQQLYSSFISLWGARALLALAAAGIVLFSLTSLNPVVTEEPVPGNVAFNALLLAYLAPVPLLWLIARRLDGLGLGALRPAVGLLALVLVLAYVTLETKRVFQGHLLVAEAQSVAESYAYSAVWLALAVALFAAGIRMGQQYVRYAGLGVMVLVVLKVFLWDMSSLEGLYRIASFIGLGLCLVGIGWLYQRFVQPPKSTAPSSTGS